MKPNYYQIIKDCVETGSRIGISRAYKHTDDPSYSDIETFVDKAIMIEIMNKFIFDQETQDEEEPNYSNL
jgi:hypothetical protein